MASDETMKVSVPHKLGRDEARRRLERGLGKAGGASFATVDERWTGDRLDFTVAALGQRISGWADVRDDRVDLEVRLPWLLKKLAETFRPALEKETRRALELPAPKETDRST